MAYPSPSDLRRLWAQVSDDLGPLAGSFTGPIEWVGEGDRSVALGRDLEGEPVVIKLIFSRFDHRVGEMLEGSVYHGLAAVLYAAPWNPRGYGVVVQERACMHSDMVGGICSAFSSEDAERLNDVVEHLLHPDDADRRGADDPFVDDLEAGISELAVRVRTDDVEFLDDLHLGNVGLVMRAQAPEAVIIDLGTVPWSDEDFGANRI